MNEVPGLGIDKNLKPAQSESETIAIADRALQAVKDYRKNDLNRDQVAEEIQQNKEARLVNGQDIHDLVSQSVAKGENTIVIDRTTYDIKPLAEGRYLLSDVNNDKSDGTVVDGAMKVVDSKQAYEQATEIQRRKLETLFDANERIVQDMGGTEKMKKITALVDRTNQIEEAVARGKELVKTVARRQSELEGAGNMVLVLPDVKNGVTADQQTEINRQNASRELQRAKAQLEAYLKMMPGLERERAGLINDLAQMVGK